MSGKLVKNCLVCGTRRCKSLPSRYKWAATWPIFCSQRCAAQWGLLQVAVGDGGQRWCSHAGWVCYDDACCDYHNELAAARGRREDRAEDQRQAKLRAELVDEVDELSLVYGPAMRAGAES